MGDGFAFIEIIFFAMLAGFLVYQLHRVLGRRTGHEQRNVDPFAAGERERSDNVVKLPGRDGTAEAANDQDVTDEDRAADDESAVSGLSRLKALGPTFEEKEFLRGARKAFEWIVLAYARGDADALRPLLSPDLYSSFAAAIQAREEAGETFEINLGSIRTSDLVDIVVAGGNASVTVEFVSEQVKVTRDADAKVIDGDPDRLEVVTDIWTFMRPVESNDPNWQLVATREPER